MSDQFNCGIYKITNLVNDKIYIGQSVDIKDRISRHKRELKYGIHNNEHLQSAWNKYGEPNFIFETIFICARQYLDKTEKLFVKTLNSSDRKFGYNCDSGGNNKKILSSQTIEKIKLARSHQKITEKMLNALKLRRIKPMSEDNKRKLILANKGKTKSEYVRSCVSNANGISVVQIDKNTNEEIKTWKNGTLAANSCGAKKSSLITMCIRGKVKTAYGYKWRYAVL